MAEVVADQHYYYDAEGKVTTDESKGERWLAREGAAVLPEHQAALAAFQKGPDEAGPEAAPDEEADGGEKASRPSANKAKTPSKNKGAK
jgi:hypothetical protein